MKDVFLNDFFIINPEFSLSQAKLIDWMTACHLRAEQLNKAASAEPLSSDARVRLEKTLRHYAVKPTQISQRFFECPDAFVDDFLQARIYCVDEKSQVGVGIKERTQYYSEKSFRLFKNFYASTTNKPDHIIHVTCTGYISPSAPQMLVANPEWSSDTEVTHAYHMGCYASMPAVRLAQGLVLAQVDRKLDFKTDIVHTEMCSLHMNPLGQTPEQIVVQTLFADGHVKYSASLKRKQDQKNLRLITVHEKIIPDSDQDMSWIPSSWGMEMTLSRHVPKKIKNQLNSFIQQLFKKAGLDEKKISQCQFAVHPGGPKIIDSVQETLQLTDRQTEHSRYILRERGNMSSATLPHIWNRILNDNGIDRGTSVVSLAFGPGLTVFGSLFEVT